MSTPNVESIQGAFEALLRASGLTPAQIEAKRHLLEKVAAETDRPMERTKINPGAGEPGKDYVWVSDVPETRAKYESLGYVPCKRDGMASQLFRRQDKTWKNGDAVLYEVDSDTREARKYASALSSFRQTRKGGEKRFVNFAQQLGGKAEVLSDLKD